MKRVALRFPRWARLVFSAAFLLSFVSGILWYSLGRWGEVEGEFGPEKHPWLAPLAKVHGGGAFVALISIGVILGGHLPPAWSSRLSRKSGLVMLADLAFMIVTAYGLYYAGSDEVREQLVVIHLVTGLAFPGLLTAHIVSGRRRTKNQ